MRLILGLVVVGAGCGSVDKDTSIDRDLDNDGIPDADDLCPAIPEGVGGDGDGCPDTEPNYATIGANWTLKTINGATAACPNGYDTIAFYNVAVDADGNPLSPNCSLASQSTTCFIDLFNCTSPGSAVSAPLPPARYQTWLAVTNSTGANIYATSLSAFLNVTQVDLDFNASIFLDGGYFALDWALEGAVSNNPLTCTQAGATGIETVITVSGGSTMVDAGDAWPCDAYYGVTAALPAGTYTVSVDAFSSGGALGTAAPFTNQAIQAGNRVTDLGTVIIPIDNM